MTPPDPHPQEPRPAPAERGGAVRRFCPRCGAGLGTLAGAPRAGEPVASALYCGCCGLVVPAA